MTAQIPDTCVIDGQKSAIEGWSGNTDCIPSNENLGIDTISPHTANWSGRIDHFMVYNNRLYLFKIEVNLTKSCRELLPINIRREVLTRYEPMWFTDSNGSRTVVCEYHFEYLMYDDLLIPFTGELDISYPYIDEWELPSELNENPGSEISTLNFIDGILQ